MTPGIHPNCPRSDGEIERPISDTHIPPVTDELDELKACLTGDLSGIAEIVGRYEYALAEYFGAAHCVALSSGTAAIQVALGALGVGGRKHQVLVSPTCPLCTVLPILASGVEIVFCDTGEGGFGLDLRDAERLLSGPVQAVVEVPMWGYPTDLARLYELARTRGVPLIGDLAHCHGATLHGHPLSDFCDIACFSTQNSKVLSTGEGGFVLTPSESLAERMRNLANFGGLSGADFGLNYKLGAAQAAIGLSRLRVLDENLMTRRGNAAFVLKRISATGLREPEAPHDSTPNYYRMVLRTSGQAGDLIGHLLARGVPSDIVKYRPRPLYEYPLFKPYRRECPNARRLLQSVTTVPVHPGLEAAELERIAAALAMYIPRRRD